jgi:Mg2+ and Co2+ transporter CorA
MSEPGVKDIDVNDLVNRYLNVLQKLPDVLDKIETINKLSSELRNLIYTKFCLTDRNLQVGYTVKLDKPIRYRYIDVKPPRVEDRVEFNEVEFGGKAVIFKNRSDTIRAIPLCQTNTVDLMELVLNLSDAIDEVNKKLDNEIDLLRKSIDLLKNVVAAITMSSVNR